MKNIYSFAFRLILSCCPLLGVLSASAGTGLTQVIYSAMNYEGTEASKVKVAAVDVPGVILACTAPGTSSISYEYGGVTYKLEASTTAAYTGYMKMTGGLTYTFVKSFDDAGYIRIDNGASWLLKDTSYKNIIYASFTPPRSGLYPIEIRVANGTGGVGPYNEPFKTISAGLLWSTTETTCTAENVGNWNKFLNTDDNTFLFTTGNRQIDSMSVSQGTAGALKATIMAGEGSGGADVLYLVSDTSDKGEDFASWTTRTKVTDVTAAAQTLTHEFAGAGTTDTVYRFALYDENANLYSFTDPVNVMANPLLTVEIDDDMAAPTATADIAIVNCGRGKSATDVFFAYGPASGSLGEYATIATGAALGDALEASMSGLQQGTAYAWSVAVDNGAGRVEVASGTFVHGGWTYDAAAKTISNDDWTFNVTVNGTSMTVVSVKIPGDSTEIFFNTPVRGFDGVITDIGASLFKSNTDITKVVLPETLKTIGGSAFCGCVHLTSVTPLLPDSVTSVGQQAFDGCTRLSASLVRIGCAKNDDDSVRMVSVGDYVFRNCRLIENAEIGLGLTKVPSYTFQYNFALKTVKLHDGITSIGNNAFNGCSVLETVTPLTPSALTYIGGQAFYQSPNLTGEVTLGMNGSFAFGGENQFDGAKIMRVTLGPGVTSVSGSCFKNVSTMTSLTLGENITSIGSSAFNGCSSLTEVELPAGLKTIGGSAFNYCTSLTRVTPFLPETITSIGDQAFYQCTSLEGELELNPPSAMSVGQHAFSYTRITKATIGSQVTELKSQAFNACSSLREVTLSEGLQTIGASAFSGCSSLVKVAPYLPKSVKTIGDSAFQNCTKLALPVTVGGSGEATSVGKQVFYQNDSLESVTLGAGVTALKDYFLMNSKKVSKLVFGTKPTWTSSSFQGWGDYQCRFIFGKDDAGWQTFLTTAGNMTAWADLSDDVKAKYTSAYPGEPEPWGLTAVTPKKQWLVSYGRVETGKKDVTISGKSGEYGTVDPAYGTYKNVSLPMVLTAPRYQADGLVTYEATGYVVETPALAGWGSPATNEISGTADPRSVSYTQAEDGARRFSWLWTPVAYRVALTLPAASAGTATVSKGDFSDDFFKFGSVATVTATGANGAKFVRWHGDVPAAQATQNPIQLTMDGPKTLAPEFESPWVYDAKAKTLSDGYWVLNASGTADAIVVGKPKTVYALGLLDLTKPVADNGVIKEIGQQAFTGDGHGVREIRLPETLKTIGYQAFYNTTILTNVVPCLPDSVTTVANQAFYMAKNLKSTARIGFGGEPLTVGEYMFGTSGVTDIQVGPGVTVIPGNFASSSSVCDIQLHEGITTFGYRAFSQCGSLTNVCPVIPAALTQLNDWTYYSCTKLRGSAFIATNNAACTISGSYHFGSTAITNIVTGTGVKAIPSSFAPSSSLRTLKLPGVVKIGDSAFSSCGSLREVTLSQCLESVGYRSFFQDTAIKTVEPFFPKSCTNIGAQAFYDCKALVSKLSFNAGNRPVVFASPATGGSFSGCLALPEIRLGNCSELPIETFKNCTAVKEVYFHKTLPATIKSSVFTGWTANQSCLYVPRGDAAWVAWIAANVTPWAELDWQDRDTFRDYWKTGKDPVGRTNATANPAKQYVRYWNPNASFSVILR